MSARPGRVSLVGVLTLGCGTPGAAATAPGSGGEVRCVPVAAHESLAHGVVGEDALFLSVAHSFARTEIRRVSLRSGETLARGEVPSVVGELVGLADLDRDGHLDLVAGKRVIFAVDRPAAEWELVELRKGPTSWGGGAAVGDLDGDGAPELVATNLAEGGVEIVVTRFAGDRQPTQIVAGEDPWLAYDLSLGDADADGRVDVSTLADRRAPGPGEASIEVYDGPRFAERSATTRLSLWSGDGTGGLAPPRAFDSHAKLGGLELADFEPGGALEYALLAWHPHPEIRFASIAGDELRTLASLSLGADGLTIADLDDDGHLDLIATGDGTRLFRGGPFPEFELWHERVGIHRAAASDARGVLLVGRTRGGEALWCAPS